MKLGISFFGSHPGVSLQSAYQTILEATRRADQYGFTGVWFPERHFDELGAWSPNPSILASAVSQTTSQIKLRAGSVVLPLHHSVRVAEEWAVIDQLSKGRAELGLATGWHAHDFIFQPDAYVDRRQIMETRAREIQQLWSGESVSYVGGGGEPVEIRLFPQPIQKELNLWFAAVSNPETFAMAARMNAGVLTNLLRLEIDDLSKCIDTYKTARAQAGLDPDGGRIAVLMHTLVLRDKAIAMELARGPLKSYLEETIRLGSKMQYGGMGKALESLSQEDMDYLFKRGLERYVDGRSLIGTPESVTPSIQRLAEIGVDEIACFVDFGVPSDVLLQCVDVMGNALTEFLQ